MEARDEWVGGGEGGLCTLAVGCCFVRIHSGPKCIAVVDMAQKSITLRVNSVQQL